MRKPLLTLIAVVAFAGGLTPNSTGQSQNRVEDFMCAKMVHAHKVLEGLARENYDTIEKHGQELSLLSQAASSQVLQTVEYHEHSLEFRSAAASMVNAAKRRDLDATALGYAALTLKCVSCHKYVRRIRTASAELPGQQLLADYEPAAVSQP